MRRLIKHLKNEKLLIFLSVIGPGIITANVDNDAGGIATYSLAGAHFGYSLLWLLLPVTVLLVMVQEMVARLGVVTGKGLSDLIREEYGVKTTLFTMIALLLTNLGNVTAEFAGVAASLEIFGISRYISIPVGGAMIWYLVVRGNYRLVEKVFLAACAIYLAYVISGILARPNWSAVIGEVVQPRIEMDLLYLVMLVGIVGTTIAPWMQFYQQSTIVEKEIKVEHYRYVRWDVIIGCVLAAVVVAFIIIACAATLHVNNIRIQTAEDAAVALAPLAGHYASFLFALGLANASLFAASILPLSTAYSVCEGVGWEAGIGKSFHEAPQFIGLYTGLIIIGGALVLIPEAPLIHIMLISQVINGILLPFILIFILLLVNKRTLMGDYINSPLYNKIIWLAVVLLIVLSVMLLAMMVGRG